VCNCLWKVSLDCADVEVSNIEAGWRILVSEEFQRKGAAELKERLPVSSLTGGRRRVMTDAERVERLDCNSSFFARYRGCYVEGQCMLLT